MRGLVKWTAEGLLSHGPVFRAGLRRGGGRALILAYHGILPDGEPPTGEHSLHLDRSDFADQLDELVRWTRVVPLGALLDGAVSDRRPLVAITFDDAYRGAVTAGAEELEKRGLPATVFVAPGLLGGGTFWWDELAGGHGGSLPEPFRSRALTTWQGDADRVRAEAAEVAASAPRPGRSVRSATEAELRAAVESGTLDAANHTWSHRNLAVLDDAERETEISRAAAWLAERFPAALPVLALPYGLGATESAGAAERTGIRAVLRVEGGWHRPGRDPCMDLPRLNVPRGMSRSGFRIRLAGLLE
jgi:peptidoglycan/xylan/chitin deacetylase (PgdA/CDA1 family)